MNILITAGGTSEKIDDVRHLTNHATGSLGKEIATLLQSEEQVTIHYVYGPQAVLPEGSTIHFYPIRSVKELEQQMKELLTTLSFDYVIHSMAVSDYEVETATNEALLAKELAKAIAAKQATTQEQIERIIQETLKQESRTGEPTQKKISSASDKLILVMKKAPKVITSIKKWQPSVSLIGFKLLVDVPEEELVAVAQRSLETNQADFILANDLIHITSTQHLGLLVTKDGVKARFQTKKEIAQGLKELILERKDDL